MRLITGVLSWSCVLLSAPHPLAGQTYPPGPIPGDPDYTIIHAGGMGAVDTSLDLSVLCDDTGLALVGWSLSVCVDADVAVATQVVPGAATLEATGGTVPAFHSYGLFPGQGWTLGCVLDFFGMDMVPPGLGLELEIVTYDLVGEGTAETMLCNHLGWPPALNSIVTSDGDSHYPTEVPGTIEVVTTPPFLRGDVNGNGHVELADMIQILTLLFGPGDPTCFQTMDVNDDEGLGLVDPLHGLSALFLGGPEIPAPISGCGVDPTAGALECAQYTCP